MLKRFVIPGVLICLFALGLCAQSGRRMKNSTPAPAATPAQTEGAGSGTETTEDETGVYTWDKYSESSSSARSISASRPQMAEKDKKSKKNEDANKAEEAASAAKPAAGGAGDDEVLKVETNLISIPVSVYSRNGNYISELSKQNFKIFEDGKEQEVAYFSTTEKPFTVILLIDVSPSTAYKIEEIQNAAMAFVDQLRPQDQVMVIQFDSRVTTLTKPDFTKDHNEVSRAIHRTGFGDGTSLYEAVDTALRKRLKGIEGRKAIILFTDGVDTTSVRATEERNFKDAEESEAVIFPIYYNTYLQSMGIGGGNGPMTTSPTLGLPPGIGGIGGGMGSGGSAEEYSRGRAYLQTLADLTGGRMFRPDGSPMGLSKTFEGIADELRNQYSIGYYPTNEGDKGQRKAIKVRVNRPNLVVRARDSYIVGAMNETQSSK